MSTLERVPRRFYLNLTERCQLRCRHCLTCAPTKTHSKRAQDMSLEVLEALKPWLVRADYVSLSHAGEPTLSDQFRPLLEFLSTTPVKPRVHLMTNGYGLEESVLRWAVKCGLRALVISIDGLSPETHDWLRVGSSIRELEKTIVALARTRQASELPVRLGISWTVNRRNLAELYGLPDRARTWGIDAIKLEELVLTSRETSELGPVPESQLSEALSFVRGRCQALSLVFVDHTPQRGTLRCQRLVREADAEFIVADDFINADVIHPCCAPDDTVFIEADGTVKPVSFNHPGAGNLLDSSLEQIFCGEHFQAWRECVRRRRLCRRVAPCGDDS